MPATTLLPATRDDAQEYLNRIAGLAAVLREDQWTAIDALVNQRRKAVVVQRTGWGKSAVYWIATALLRARGSGPTLVISPLLALMRDQVAAAAKAGIRAATLNSANGDDWPDIEAAIAANEIDVLLISPERLNAWGFRQRVLPHLAGRIGLLVIDEAHTLSDWGSDFRPDYRRIRDVLAGLPDGTPVLATTATANSRVTADVADQIGTDVITLRGSLDRTSLTLSVVPTPSIVDAYAWISDALNGGDALGAGGIIYVLTVAETQRLAGFLTDQGHNVAAYSSDTPAEDRARLEADLLGGRLRALVATSSLGMGLDMPHLSFVIHLGSPNSPISYYQQVGRAGRALDHADGVLLPTAADENIWAYFDSTAFPPEATVRKVLAALADADGPLSVPALETQTGLRRGRLESLLKVLDVDGAVARADGGYAATGQHWRYDQERYDGIAAARRAEQAQMREYLAGRTCLMTHLRHALDDPDATPCGRCSACTGTLPSPGAAADPATVAAARAHLRGQDTLIEPRKQWPSGASRRGRISVDTRAEVGRALAIGQDPAWGDAVTAALSGDAAVSGEVLDGIVGVLRRWGWPAGRPSWVTWVPSRQHGVLLADLATRVAELGRMQLANPWTASAGPRQADASGQVAAANGPLGRLSITGEVPSGPCLLVDDVTRSGWTFTVAAALLREAGAGPVYPLALHKAF
jgi:ATP-dependent DNA helicase RecQ